MGVDTFVKTYRILLRIIYFTVYKFYLRKKRTMHN